MCPIKEGSNKSNEQKAIDAVVAENKQDTPKDKPKPKISNKK